MPTQGMPRDLRLGLHIADLGLSYADGKRRTRGSPTTVDSCCIAAINSKSTLVCRFKDFDPDFVRIGLETSKSL